jgi:hypothetical protein
MYAAANLAGEHVQQQSKADFDTRDDFVSEGPTVLVIAVAYTAGGSGHLLGCNAADLRRVYPRKIPAAVGNDVDRTN